MALHDLSLVTQSLVRLVDAAIKASPARPTSPVTGPVDVIVTSLPPDMLTTEDNMVGIYLYHLVEEAAHKNQPWPNRPQTPIRYTPMGLNLHYLVTARSTRIDELGPYREQLLLGLAVKALHDYPIIDDHTSIGGTKAFPLQMLDGGNRLRLALRHIPPNEAVAYWTAGSQPLRLSAYYEVSVVLVEPEEPATASGRVFTWGVTTFVGGLPQLSTSRSTVVLRIPGEAADRRIEVQPAQAALGDELTLIGTGLGGGSLELRLRGPDLTAPQPVGPLWAVNSAGDAVFATVQDTLDGDPARPIVPGTYAATLAVTRVTTLADGTSHTQTIATNETPFQIVPKVEPGAVAATGEVTVTGGRFVAPVRASVAGLALTLVAGAPGPGEFRIVSPTELELRLPAGAPSGTWVPVRVLVNGSESPPRWVQVP